MKNYFLICVVLLFNAANLFSQVNPPAPPPPGGPPTPPVAIDSHLSILIIFALILGFYLIEKRKQFSHK